jgi:hypothetical protein
MALLELPSELLALIHRDLELLTSLPPRRVDPRVDRIICTNLKLKGSFGNFVALARSILSRLLLRRRTPTAFHYLKLAGRVQDGGIKLLARSASSISRCVKLWTITVETGSISRVINWHFNLDLWDLFWRCT